MIDELPHFCESLANGLDDNGKRLACMRVKLLAMSTDDGHKNRYCETDFIDPRSDVEPLRALADKIGGNGCIGKSEAELWSALETAMHSDWSESENRKRNVIVVIDETQMRHSDDGDDSAKACMERAFEVWETEMSHSAKRMFVFAPIDRPWNELCSQDRVFQMHPDSLDDLETEGYTYFGKLFYWLSKLVAVA